MLPSTFVKKQYLAPSLLFRPLNQKRKELLLDLHHFITDFQ